MNHMKDRVNFYFSMIIMFIAGALAMFLIVRVAENQSKPRPATPDTEASYVQLQQSILKNN